MKVIFIVGSTASGKSQLAFAWAQRLGGAIINCDSIQAYQGLDIGSAKPSKQERAQIPHFLFDHIPIGQISTAGQYQREFHLLLKSLEKQFPVVFVVGGTGFYFQAIEKGMYSIGAADPKTISKVEAEIATVEGREKLYSELVEKDPVSAAKISPNDQYRLARAIEMMRTHGRPVSEIRLEFAQKSEPFSYPLLKLGIQISKENLLPRVEARTNEMFKSGLIPEVQGLIDAGWKDWAPLQSVGYRESLQFLSGEIADLENLRDKIIQNTMRLAKKQRTWFRRDREIQWLLPEDLELGLETIRQFLK